MSKENKNEQKGLIGRAVDALLSKYRSSSSEEVSLMEPPTRSGYTGSTLAAQYLDEVSVERAVQEASEQAVGVLNEMDSASIAKFLLTHPMIMGKFKNIIGLNMVQLGKACDTAIDKYGGAGDENGASIRASIWGFSVRAAVAVSLQELVAVTASLNYAASNPVEKEMPDEMKRQAQAADELSQKVIASKIDAYGEDIAYNIAGRKERGAAILSVLANAGEGFTPTLPEVISFISEHNWGKQVPFGDKRVFKVLFYYGLGEALLSDGKILPLFLALIKSRFKGTEAQIVGVDLNVAGTTPEEEAFASDILSAIRQFRKKRQDDAPKQTARGKKGFSSAKAVKESTAIKLYNLETENVTRAMILLSPALAVSRTVTGELLSPASSLEVEKIDEATERSLRARGAKVGKLALIRANSVLKDKRGLILEELRRMTSEIIMKDSGPDGAFSSWERLAAYAETSLKPEAVYALQYVFGYSKWEDKDWSSDPSGLERYKIAVAMFGLSLPKVAGRF